jgi:hypothetical protein
LIQIKRQAENAVPKAFLYRPTKPVCGISMRRLRAKLMVPGERRQTMTIQKLSGVVMVVLGAAMVGAMAVICFEASSLGDQVAIAIGIPGVLLGALGAGSLLVEGEILLTDAAEREHAAPRAGRMPQRR